MGSLDDVEVLAKKIADKIYKEQYSLLEEKGLTPRDREMFTRCLKAYAKTENELASVRMLIVNNQEVPSEYKDNRPTVSSPKARRSKAKTQEESEALSDIARAIRSIDI